METRDEMTLCGFCGKVAAVTKAWRPEIREPAPHGYVEVLVLDCGKC